MGGVWPGEEEDLLRLLRRISHKAMNRPPSPSPSMVRYYILGFIVEVNASGRITWTDGMILHVSHLFIS